VIRPLEGRVVLVTRPVTQAGPLARRLVALGAVVLRAPTIAITPPDPGGPLDRAIAQAADGQFDWVVFTSASGVRAWTARAAAVGGGPPRARLAAVGEATAGTLREGGLEPDLVPETYTTAALGAAFPSGRGRLLLARADLATSELEAVLRTKGWTPLRVDAYRVRPVGALPDEAVAALREGRVEAVTFTSPSTVNGFVRVAGAPSGFAVVCIGPVTAATAEAAGFQVDAIADPHTTEGLVDAVARALA
jgi:uroporphyrinogen-III synthase